jgi:DNA-binding XRE family transcriptional regulator
LTALIKTDKVMAIAKTTSASPIGKTVEQGAARRRAKSAAYREAQESHAAAAAFAKEVIHLRSELRLTQEGLAKKVGTSHTQISRIESGRHLVSNRTMRRVLIALGVVPLMGYRVPARNGRPARQELIAV